MELTQEDVLEILGLLETAKDVEHLEVRIGDTHVVASKHGPSPATAAATAAASPPAAAPVEPAPPPASSPAPPAAAPASPPEAPVGPAASDAPPAPTPAAAAGETGGDDTVTVDAPVVGVFYRAPEPGADPFVEVGSRVEEDTTLGLVEVMKTFNSVTAGVRGTVTAVLADNEAFVEHGQPLFAIAPDPSA